MSVTAPAGFTAAGVHCGIKPDPEALDLALVAGDPARPGPVAAVFTANRAPAAPVQVSRAHLAATGGRAVGVVLNSGNANAATGDPGHRHSLRTCELAAAALGCRPEEVLVCSTGLIGIPLPMEAVEAGVAGLVRDREAGREAAARAADAIRTTDTVSKETIVGGDGFTVGGMAKGAAMLAPRLVAPSARRLVAPSATMLAVLTTDAVIGPSELERALVAAVEESFNALSVDGSTSTNDTVIALARAGSGEGGAPSDAALVAAALAQACADLAAQMAGDAEGATKVIRVRVTGAASGDDARHAARKVAESQLVKCSLYGADPYWGRVVSELGAAGVEFDLHRVSVAYGDVVVCRDGVARPHDEAALARHLAGRHVDVTAHLGLGEGAATILTNDLTPAYIAENMRTS